MQRRFLFFQRVPEQLDIDFGASARNLLGNLFCHGRKVAFVSRPMNDNYTIAADTEIASARVHEVKFFVLLFADVADFQIIGVEKFDDPAFQRHV